MLRQNCGKIVNTQKLLIFVSGFLSVSNDVGNNGCKKISVKEGEWLYGKKNEDINVGNFVTQGKKNYIHVWTEKC